MANNKGGATAVGRTSAQYLPEPAGHRVLIRVDNVEERTSGGLFRPEQAKDMEQRANDIGTVLAVGRTAWWAHREIDEQGRTRNGQPWAKPGDRVLFSTYAGRDVPASMRELIDPTARKIIVANDEDILLVL